MKTNLSYEFLAYTGQCRTFSNWQQNVIHPFDSFRAVPDSLLKVVCRILGRSPLETMKLRLETIKTWRGLADSLAEANHQIFSNMDSGCALVLKGQALGSAGEACD